MVDGAVAGFLTVERHFDHAAEISWMAVHADHRRRGLGHLLVERLCRDLARDLPGLWPGDTAVMMVRQLP